MKPWLTKALINACKKKNAMYRKVVESKLQAGEVEYKVYKNKLTKILKAAERHYYSEQLNIHKNNMKVTWKILKKDTPHGINSPSLPPSLELRYLTAYQSMLASSSPP